VAISMLNLGKAIGKLDMLLFGGSMFYYKTMNDPTPKGHIDLKGYTINGEAKAGDKKKFAFSIDKDGKTEFSGQLPSKELKESWVSALKVAVTQEASEAPSKDGTAKKKKTNSWNGNAKRNCVCYCRF